MRYIITIFIVFICYINSYSQNAIPIRIISGKEIFEKQFFIDTDFTFSKLIPLDVAKFEVKFFEMNYNKSSNEVHLKGQVCFRDTVKCKGLQGVIVFTAFYKNGKLYNKTEIGESSFTSKGAADDGLFDFTFKNDTHQKLYFYFPFFYAKEYEFKINK